MTETKGKGMAMTELVCLLVKDSDYEEGYGICYIMPKDDEYVEFWMSDRFKYENNPEYHKLRPYKEGDIAMTCGNKIMLGLQILFKYNINLELHSEHDELWAGGKGMTQEEMCVIMSEEDVKRMEELGWSESEESWHHWT